VRLKRGGVYCGLRAVSGAGVEGRVCGEWGKWRFEGVGMGRDVWG